MHHVADKDFLGGEWRLGQQTASGSRRLYLPAFLLFEWWSQLLGFYMQPELAKLWFAKMTIWTRESYITTEKYIINLYFAYCQQIPRKDQNQQYISSYPFSEKMDSLVNITNTGLNSAVVWDYFQSQVNTNEWKKLTYFASNTSAAFTFLGY